MEGHGSVVNLLTSFQCHKLASALPGVPLHCLVSLILLSHLSEPIKTLICVMVKLIKPSEVYLQIV